MEYYVKCWEKYADFSGRARREEYWMFQLFNAIITIILFFVGQNLSAPIYDVGNINLLSAGYNLLIFIPSLSVAVRRLHDTNNSGWMLLIGLIPVIGWIWLFVLFVTEGDSKKNKYGKNPKTGGSELEERNLQKGSVRRDDTIDEVQTVANSRVLILNKIELLEKSYKLGLVSEIELNEKKLKLEQDLKKEDANLFESEVLNLISKDVEVLRKLKAANLLTEIEFKEKVKLLTEKKRLEMLQEYEEEYEEEVETQDSSYYLIILIIVMIFIIFMVKFFILK